MNRPLLCLTLLISSAIAAQEVLVTLHSTVSGNREQPRVMYIVPWQHPDDAEFEYGLQGSFAGELFVPVDREEFVRELQYQAMIESVGGDNSDQNTEGSLNVE